MRFQTLKAGIFALLQPITEVGDLKLERSGIKYNTRQFVVDDS
jgi:hypothetical protein